MPMEIDIKNLPKSPELLEKLVLNLQNELIAFKAKYARMFEEFRLSKLRSFAPSSEKNLLQPDIFDEPGVELPEEVKAQLEDNEEKDEIEVKGHTRKKHPVRKPLPMDIPHETVLHDIPEAEKICRCGSELIRIGEETSEQLKFIPAQLSVICHVRPKYACKPCQENVKIAPMPILLLPKSIATPELIAHTLICKYCDHLPLYRQETIWQRLEIDLPRSSLCGWLMKVAELCVPLHDLLQKNIIKENYTQADETTVQVLEEVGRDNTQKSYMWCYYGGDAVHPSIVFDYEETRGGYHAENFLKDFKGSLQTDAYSGYNWVEKYPEIIPFFCMAHARRPFTELVKLTKTPGLATEALKFFKALYKFETEARDNKLSFEARLALRQKKAEPVLTAFKTWLDRNLPKTQEDSKIGKAIRYCVKHWVELTNYLKDGQVEIDNNRVENVIRPFALGRKNWLFMGSPKGAKAGAIFYSLIETCKANNIEPYKYFCTMLHQIRFCKSEDDYQNLINLQKE
jgi:transposase